LLNPSKAVATGWNRVAVDYKTGFQQAIGHLRTLGHRNIGFIAGPPDIGSAMRRLAAFREALETSGLTFRNKWAVAGDFHVEGGFSAMAELLRQGRAPTAVIATNDLMAIGAMHAVHAKGLSVPGDVSIIGFDNIDICTMSNPPLTSIGISREAIATHAFEMLHNSLTSTRGPKAITQTVSTSLVIRKSTGRVKA
jgi:LacI family transcriptional regulator